jgi:quinate dehydrogenase
MKRRLGSWWWMLHGWCHQRDLLQDWKSCTCGPWGLESPYYVVGTVPDFEPQTPEERDARDILEIFFANARQEEGDGGKGVILDMCFKPRVTRQIKLAKEYGWRTVEGTEVIGHQIEEQWRLWTGRVLTKGQQEEAWRVLRREAEESKAINF